MRQSELKDLLGVLLFFILLKDRGKCGIGACELRPHPPHATHFVGVVLGPLKNISPALFITLFAMEMRGAVAGVRVATTAFGMTKWFRCGQLLVSLLRRKFRAGGVLSAILTTSPPRFLAAKALA